MARKAREKSSTGIYAIVLRGSGDVFRTEEMRGAFCDAAKKYLGRGLIGAVFSDNRVDMLVRESDKGISLDMKPLITSFARTYNRENETDGKVFADRFRSVPVEAKAIERACRAYMKGGDIAAPYIIGAAPAAAAETEKKTGKKKTEKAVAKPEKKVTVKTAKKPEKTVAKPEKRPEKAAAMPKPEQAPKPKKKSNLPSWLL